MTPQESVTSFRELKMWQGVRIITGILVIFAGIVTVVTGIAALTNGRDTSSAMKLPVALALVCIMGFVHAQKKILSMRMPNNPRSHPSASGLGG
jgi:hypothetical protein